MASVRRLSQPIEQVKHKAINIALALALEIGLAPGRCALHTWGRTGSEQDSHRIHPRGLIHAGRIQLGHQLYRRRSRARVHERAEYQAILPSGL